jgi:hypothetical protein
MNRTYLEDHVLPRPVVKLPDYANAKSRRTLAEKMVGAFHMSEEAASAIADAVVDPSSVRGRIGEVQNPQFEEIPVPGGTIWGIRTHVWSRRVLPDPRNPRTGPSRRHPFAVDPGTGGEDSRFRPVPEPRSPENAEDAPELVVDLDSRHHLEWAAGQAAKYVFAHNDWRQSIASQGVMEAVWVVPTTYTHADGAAPVTVLTTVEGSSRMTAVHDLLGVRSADVPYDENDQRLRAHIRKLNDAFGRDATGDQLIALRGERVPALILVGFRKNAEGTAGFPTAVKSLVALRHVDHPEPWGEGPEHESLADEVLDELYRQGLITVTERAYYAGACTKAEALAAHLSDDPAIRASRIVQLFAGDDERINAAIRVAVTSQSTRKRLTRNLFNDLATALIVRSLAGDPGKVDQMRRYMRVAFGKAVYSRPWESTERDTEVLVKEALREVRRSIGDDTIVEPGPASLELAVRAAYPLLVDGALNADRGTAGNNQPDRRIPGEVLEAMRHSIQGVHQLTQALRDFRAEQSIRAVDEDGQLLEQADGSGYQIVTDYYLRVTFPPPGKILARSHGATPAEVLRNRLVDFSSAIEGLEKAYDAIRKVVGHDGGALVDADGVDPRSGREWRKLLGAIGDDLNFWGRTFAKRHGSVAPRLVVDDSEDADDQELADVEEEADDLWDAEDEAA